MSDPISFESTLFLTGNNTGIEVPPDLAQAEVRDAFDALAPSARKAHVTDVEGAKADEIRERRITAIVAKLR